MPEAGRSQAHRRDLCEAQPTDAGMDQLFRHREHEGLSERIRPMDAAQGPSGHPKAVEEAEDHLQESAKAEPVWEVQSQR